VVLCWHQFGGHGVAGAVGMEVDDENFDAEPFCIDDIAEAGGNDGRGDIRDTGSLEGDTLRDEGLWSCEATGCGSVPIWRKPA